MVESRGHHWSVKSRPAARLQQQRLQNVQIAEAHEALRPFQPLRQPEINQVIRSVSPARGNDAIYAFALHRLGELREPLFMPARKISLRIHRRWLFHYKS